MKWKDLALVVAAFVVLLGVNFAMGAILDYFHIPISTTLIIIITIAQAFFGYMNVHSSRLHWAHLVSSSLWIILQVGVVLSTTEWEKLSIGQWIVGFVPVVLSLLPPIVYRKSATGSWIKPMLVAYLIFTLILVHYLHNTGFYQIYSGLQMLSIALVILALPHNKIKRN